MRISDWSSDVCSSDLVIMLLSEPFSRFLTLREFRVILILWRVASEGPCVPFLAAYAMIVKDSIKRGEVGAVEDEGRGGKRSEERRVGKECVSTCRSRRSACH